MARHEYVGAAPETTISGSITAGSPTSGGTFSVLDGTGYPTGSTGPFVVALDAGTVSEEKVLCSIRTGNVFTVATTGRGYDNTAAASHGGATTAGTVNHVFDAASATDFAGHVYDTTRDDHTQYQKKSLLTTAGDLVYATAASAWARLAIGTSGKFLKSTGTAPSWVTLASTDISDFAAAVAAIATPGVLASLEYNPASGTYTTTSTTLVAIDTTNLRLTFTAPASTNVLVEAEFALNEPNADYVTMGLLESATLIGVSKIVAYNSGAPTAITRYSTSWRKTGISVGSHSYDLAWLSGGGATATLQKGAGYPISMRVLALP